MAAPAAKPPVAWRALLLPVGVAFALAVGTALLVHRGLGLVGPYGGSAIAGVVLYAMGRALLFWDVPKGMGAVLQPVATGGAFGLAATGFLNTLFEEGPGWPATPWWLLAALLSVGVHRAHRPLLKQARAREPQGRLWGLFDRRELAALGVLVGGYAFAGLALHRLFAAFSPLIPSAGQALTLGVVAYALYGAKLLLAFAAHDEATPGAGFVAWSKANLLRNAIVVVVLVAYAIYRDDLARALPFYPLAEFGLGVALFTFLLARLRAGLRRGATERSTTSDARDHRQKVDPLLEPDYEAVAGPVTRFVETGRGQREYLDTVRLAAGLDDAQAARVLAAVQAHREPPPQPVLPFEAAALAHLTRAAFLAVAAVAFFLVFADAQMADALNAAFAAGGLALYAFQWEARRRHRAALSAGVALAGVAAVLAVFLLGLLGLDNVARMPGEAWLWVLLPAALAAGVPAFAAWRLHVDLRRGTLVPPPRPRPDVELAEGLRKARRRVGVTAGVAAVSLLLVPPLLRWAAQLPFVPSELPGFWADVMAVGAWVFASFAGEALVRFQALVRARPAVLAEARRRRALRLTLHSDMMTTLERV